MILATLALSCTTLQDPAPAGPAAPAAPATTDWQDLDRVLLVVNDDILTQGMMLRPFQRRARDLNLKNDKDRAKLWMEIFDESVRSRIKAQAGEALGFDPAQIDRIARDDFDRWKRHYDGVVGFSEWLARQDMTADEFKAARRDYIHAELWEDAVTGRGASVSARPSRDRYVRPGLLLFEHAYAQDDPAKLESLGGHPEQIRLRELLLPVPSEAELQGAHDLALSLRARIVDGEDMAGLVEQYSAVKEKGGELPPADVPSARRTLPEAARFVTEARAGQVSDVLLLVRDKLRAFVIYRLEERTPGVVPPLSELDVQKKLAVKLQEELDNFRIESALERALSSSYVWRAKPPQTH